MTTRPARTARTRDRLEQFWIGELLGKERHGTRYLLLAGAPGARRRADLREPGDEVKQ